MKKLTIIVLIFLNIKGYSQEIRTAANNAEYPQRQFFKYDNQKLTIIKENWGMYFKEDVVSQLDTLEVISYYPDPCSDLRLDTLEHLYELKLDSYGGLYPDKEITECISKIEFQGIEENYYDLNAHSFWKIFKNDPSKKIEARITSIISERPALGAIYKRLLDTSKSDNLSDQNEFYKIWDNYHIPKCASEINNIIRHKSINRIIFYIHGFNVPYSLAAVQAINTFNNIKNSISSDSTLYVPIYWPSNNAKLDSLRQENFSIKNIDDYNRNGRLFMSYSNRCYYAAITLRKIINLLDNGFRIDIIAHSLGATIATSCLINTTSKLQYEKLRRFKHKRNNAEWISKKNKKTGYKFISLDLIDNFLSTPIPKRPINVFLSASAIPGVNTFTDMDTNLIKNKKFFVTVNPNDEMLTKAYAKSAVRDKYNVSIGYISSKNLSSTTLGCNYKCDACETRKLFQRKIKNQNSFFFREVSNQTDHDFLTYLIQDGYIRYLLEFIRL